MPALPPQRTVTDFTRSPAFCRDVPGWLVVHGRPDGDLLRFAANLGRRPAPDHAA